jgi:hypothetical protein
MTSGYRFDYGLFGDSGANIPARGGKMGEVCQKIRFGDGCR